MTDADKEEIALALLLWRFLRMDCVYLGQMTWMVKDNLPVTERAEELAVLCGCKPEFFDLMMKLPLLDITVKNLDQGGKATKRKSQSRRNRKRSSAADAGLSESRT